MKKKSLIKEVKHFQKIAGLLKENESVQWMSKLNREVNGIEIYNDGDNRLFVIFDKNTGGIHVINDFNGEDFDEVWGADVDVRPELLASIKGKDNSAGNLKEYIESDPETITQAFQKAGIDLAKPVTYTLDAGRGATDEPVKMLGSELLRKLEAMRAKGEANNPNYNQEEGITYYFEPDGGEGPDFKLGIQFSDNLLYDIHQ
jgi:hypothetical protein